MFSRAVRTADVTKAQAKYGAVPKLAFRRHCGLSLNKESIVAIEKNNQILEKTIGKVFAE